MQKPTDSNDWDSDDPDDVPDYEQTEAIVTGTDGRRPVYDFAQEFKSNNIYQCIGQLMVSYDYNTSHGFRLNQVIGTATVFSVQPDIEADEKKEANIAYAFTAAHNIRFAVMECMTDKRYRRKGKKCPICKHGKKENDQREILIKPTKILFMRRSMDFNDFGCPQMKYNCFTVYLEDDKYTSNQERRAGYDWAIVGFNDDGFYDKHCKNIQFKHRKYFMKAFLRGGGLAIFGYPNNKEQTNTDYFKMYGMKSKEGMQFSVKQNPSTDRYYIIQRAIDTAPGQSGSCLWFIENGTVFIVGVHVGGKSATENNKDAYNIAVAVDEEILTKVQEIKSFAGSQLEQVDPHMNKILTEWGLQQYANIMQEEGWTEPAYWDDIDDDTFKQVLKFKSGHIATFKRKLRKATQNPTQVTVKLVIIGDSRVGKSSVVLRFIKNEYDQYKFPTIGATFLTQTVSIGDSKVKFEVWDTAGQEKYRALAPMYYRGAQAAVVVYDITDRESFDNAKKWIEEVKEYEQDCFIVLAGNKVDLVADRKVSTQEVQTYAKKNRFIFLETSAKTSENIKELFRAGAQKVLNKHQFSKQKKEEKDVVIIYEPEPTNWEGKNKKMCCT